MNTPPAARRPSWILHALLLLSALATNAQAGDLYLVKSQRPELFRDRRLQTLHLQIGDVVEGEAHATYRDWLRILANGEPYDSRAKHFASRASLREEFARTQADLVSRIERYTHRIDSAREQIYQYRSAITAIRFDSTIEYRVRKVVAATPRRATRTAPRETNREPARTVEDPARLSPGATRRSTTAVPRTMRDRLPATLPRATRDRLPTAVPGTVRRIIPLAPETRPSREARTRDPGGAAPRMRVTYGHEDKISLGRAKTQARRWRSELDKVEKSVRKWEEKRRQDMALLAASQSSMQATNRHFRAYLATRRSQPLRPYLVTVEKTALLDGNKQVAELQRGEIVLGKPNERYSRWLRIQTAERTLDGRTAHFASRKASEADTAARMARLTRLLADLQEEITDLTARERLLRSLMFSLEYKSKLAQIPLTTYPFPADYAGRTLYSGGFGPRDSVEVINGSRARSVRRDWVRELKELASQLAKERRRLETTRRDLAVTKARAEERVLRFRQVDPAERAIAPGAIRR